MTRPSLKMMSLAVLGLAVGGAAGVLAGVHGFGTSSPAEAAPATSADPLSALEVDPGPILTNAAGQTYGSMVGRELDPPDLILFVNAEGVEGYVPRELVIEELPATPEEAVAIAQEAMASRSAPTTVTMYASDGVTVVGETELGGVTTTEQMP